MNVGDRIGYVKDGVVYVERIESIRYSSGSPAIHRSLNRWQSLLRRLTPTGWRRSLLVREAESPGLTINGDSDRIGKTLAQLEQMKAALRGMDGPTGTILDVLAPT